VIAKTYKSFIATTICHVRNRGPLIVGEGVGLGRDMGFTKAVIMGETTSYDSVSIRCNRCNVTTLKIQGSSVLDHWCIRREIRGGGVDAKCSAYSGIICGVASSKVRVVLVGETSIVRYLILCVKSCECGPGIAVDIVCL
jgi:hypothetical protein